MLGSETSRCAWTGDSDILKLLSTNSELTPKYFRLLDCLQNGYQNRVEIQKNTRKSKELPARLAGRAAAGQPVGEFFTFPRVFPYSDPILVPILQTI